MLTQLPMGYSKSHLVNPLPSSPYTNCQHDLESGYFNFQHLPTTAAPITFRIKLQCFTMVLRSLPATSIPCHTRSCSSHAASLTVSCQTFSPLRAFEIIAPLHGRLLFQIFPAGHFLIFISQHRCHLLREAVANDPSKVLHSLQYTNSDFRLIFTKTWYFFNLWTFVNCRLSLSHIRVQPKQYYPCYLFCGEHRSNMCL